MSELQVLVGQRRSFIRFLISLSFYFLIFFGSGYKSFYSFDLDRNTGQGDSISYIKMHDGNFNVSPVHKYRVGIPFISSKITELVGLNKTDQLKANNAPKKRFSFFIVNTLIVAISASISLLFALHIVRGLGWFLGFAIICIGFLNPATIQNISTPMVDSPVPLFTIFIAFISIVGKQHWAPLVSGLLMPFNERIIVFLPLMMLTVKSKIKSIFFFRSLYL